MGLARTFGAGAALAAAAAVWSCAAAAADKERPGGSASFVWENDIFGGTDRNYTNGVQLSFISNPNQPLPLTGWLVDYLRGRPGFRSTDWRTGVAVGHVMYTPKDISLETPDPTDRPYAGWLFGSFALAAETNGGGVDSRRNGLDIFQIELGVVGPSAQGEWVQRNWHQMIDGEDPKGWDSQLHDEPGIVLRYDHMASYELLRDIHPFKTDVVMHGGGALGNVDTSLSMGATLRFGQGFSGDYGPPRIRPALPGGAFVEGEQINWYVFAGAEARAIARDIFLDGNTFRDSPSVDREPFVLDAQAGIAVTLGPARVAFTYVHRGESFEDQVGPDRFGAASLSWRF